MYLIWVKLPQSFRSALGLELRYSMHCFNVSFDLSIQSRCARIPHNPFKQSYEFGPRNRRRNTRILQQLATMLPTLQVMFGSVVTRSTCTVRYNARVSWKHTSAGAIAATAQVLRRAGPAADRDGWRRRRTISARRSSRAAPPASETSPRAARIAPVWVSSRPRTPAASTP